MTTTFRSLLIQEPAKNVFLDVHNPFDGSLVGRVEKADYAAYDAALGCATALHQDRTKRLSSERRIQILRSARDQLEEEAESFALGAAREGGKPLQDSRAEVQRAVDGFNVCIETLRTQSGRTIPMNLNAASLNRRAFTTLEPIGPVLAYSAFNHPVNLIAHQVLPAVATGCPVIIKPAAATPLSCFRFVTLLHEAGLPREWCQAMILGGVDLLEKAVADPRVAFFSFIGSAEVGWKLRSLLAPGTRCALEHGGAAPAIFAEDGNLERALPGLLKGSFYHAGQVCVSVQRLFVHQARLEEVSNALTEGARKLVVGDATKEETEVGPLIRKKEGPRIQKWLQESGGEIRCGGEPISDSLFPPTVLVNPSLDAKVSRDEIFGPVICVYGYTDLDEAIEWANDVPWSFQAAVISQNVDTILYAHDRLNAATVMANDHTAFRVDWMPFAGLRQSGHGVGGMPYTMAEMQVEKLLVLYSPKLSMPS